MLNLTDEKYATAPLLFKHLQHIIKGIATSLKESLAVRDTRIAALEARPAVQYEGIWTDVDGKSYNAGALVTRSGGLWLATQKTTATPGEGGTFWKLIVKRGDA